MRVQGFIWLEQFVEKLQVKHSVDTVEAEEVLTGRARFAKVKRGNVPGEDVYRGLGQTHA